LDAPAKTVLVVEDNALNMKLFTDLLRASGYRTLESRDGRDVLDLARASKPDLILMDIQLPGISGLDIARMLKADSALCAIPVLAVTAFASTNDEKKIRAAGCDGYLSKPISVRGFLEEVLRLLEPPPVT